VLINKFTVLYVEDNKEAQNHIKMILENDVKEFYQAHNGEEGLSIYKQKKPDIIISDINMPELDGLSMSHEIKKINKYQPIIIMSAFDDRKTLLRSINIGIDSFVLKPVDIDVLYDKLNTMAEHLQNKIDADNAKKKTIDNLYNLAHYDTLTKLPNRFLFDVKLDEAISKATRNDTKFILFFIDLDNFKGINDTYGHAAGDKVLESVAKNIQDIIRLEDTFARISGDEFSLIIEDIEDNIYINTLADKILEATSKPIEFQDKQISVTCSVGISRFPQDSRLKKDLLHFADTAMYKVKKLGKSKYLYYSE
jgi:diguanylate cyclase (GGDEF)-like protein